MENEKAISSQKDTQNEESVNPSSVDNTEETSNAITSEEHSEELEDQASLVDVEAFEKMSVDELYKQLSDIKDSSDFRLIDVVTKAAKPVFDQLISSERKSAFQKFVEDGGEKDGFEYKLPEIAQKFDQLHSELRKKRHEHFQNIEKQKQKNLDAKNAMLEQLRELVDGEETTSSINAVRKIQEEWKEIGMVPPAYSQTLWANYKALLDRYYDNRSIYFELKELDRKKNLEAKEELCAKAEALANVENLQDAIKELNQFHEEFKTLGPVPREKQDEIWDRFKAASDVVYARRKQFVEELKKELKINLDKKLELVEKVSAYVSFDSDRINDWNAKTNELMALQSEWEKIGGMPKEKSREVNRDFWGAFKTFFHNKGEFFKRLEKLRAENLAKKEELVAKAEALKDSEDMAGTAEELKKLQQEWKTIGPVPEKFRNSVYEKFKAACDAFFNKRRENNKSVEKAYEENLSLKEAICEKLTKAAEEKTSSIEEFEKLQSEFDEIGFVPRKAIKSIQAKYADACHAYLESLEGVSEQDKSKLLLEAKYKKIQSAPNANARLRRMEGDIRDKISSIENDISTWKTNIEFFASSSMVDQLKKEFDGKIADAQKQIKALKEELKLIRSL
ncbi:DUF349 domain-containing protein [Aureibacter tunicatorum]|uniref:DUF349 domain-containing protein n=1 Tax=Aureibacter tunicatorum TaxID=866807 RepID=A0AAE3XMS8_9BACT|nr:DUF349 domain-containing protein [Aureibacter tunicatorum]MDR6239822.1 hypothetical protein [Aureibacter tunicatorum]BDD04297.1 hypothetical protein AUTU_17800 [Aureibacter tunicatorum]